MAGQVSDQEDGEITGINVTPLVDVMLVLLIIFMVTSTYIVQQSIKVQLPKADSGESTARTKNFAFVIDKSGSVFMDGKLMGLEEVAKAIEVEKSKNPEQQLQALVAADKDTPHGFVIGLIDVVRRQGITDLAINVEKNGM